MSDKSKIEWTDATWNPITGCSVVSPGCTNCYAMKLAGTRLKDHPSRAGLTDDSKAGPVWNGQVRFNESWLDQPLRWKKPRQIFVCAHGDLFHENVPDEWIDRVFAVMALAPQHTFQVLTKRPERMRSYLSDTDQLRFAERLMRAARLSAPLCKPWTVQLADWAIHPGHPAADLPLSRDPHVIAARKNAQTFPLPNVWLMVSIEDQPRANERIPHLLATPAAVRGVSAEPLLGPIDLTEIIVASGNGWSDFVNALDHIDAKMFRGEPGSLPALDWVIAGGESGSGARPMHPDWVRSLRDQCQAAGVPFHFKQWGEWAPAQDNEIPEKFGPECEGFRCMCSNGYVGKLSIGSAFIHKPHRWPQCFPNGAEGESSCRSVFLQRIGKRAAGRQLDGCTWDEMPGGAS